jgi:hypothetical protein
MRTPLRKLLPTVKNLAAALVESKRRYCRWMHTANSLLMYREKCCQIRSAKNKMALQQAKPLNVDIVDIESGRF